MKSERQIVIKFDGQGHQVDVGTLANVLLSYSSVVQHAAKYSGVVQPVNMYVKATEPGSLDIVMSVVSQGVSGVLDFLANNKEGLAAILVLAGGVYEFKKKTAGKKHVKVEDAGDGSSVSVELEGGETIKVERNVYNFYMGTPKVSEAVSRSFEALADDPAITGFEIKPDGVDSFRAEGFEFEAMASRDDCDAKAVQVSDEAWLQVIKPCLVSSASRKWEVVHNGNRISASISDRTFLENLDRYSFHLGTMMHVQLDSYREYDETLKAYFNKKFVVTEVYSVDGPLDTEPPF